MAEWVRVAALADCPPGRLLGVEANGRPICLANVEGRVYAFEDRCTHQDFPLSEGTLDGGQIECALHGARFEVETGRVRALPAVQPVRTYEVEVRDGEVYVNLAP